jgi:Fe-S-cluster containining protein
MFQKLENLFEFVDKTVEQILQEHREKVLCKPGCADCCHALFDVSFIEAAYIATFLTNHPEIVEHQLIRAEQAALEFEKFAKTNGDPSTTRIRCPLLGDDDLCLGHKVRPINCRTYGTPTRIDGKAHVCGLSAFDSNEEYPTIDLQPLQKSLTEYSIELVGEQFGARRFPVSWVFLRTDYFLPNQEK